MVLGDEGNARALTRERGTGGGVLGDEGNARALTRGRGTGTILAKCTQVSA